MREKKGKERREEEERGGWRKKKGDEPPQRANPGSATVPFRGVVLRKFVLQALRPFGKQSLLYNFAFEIAKQIPAL